MTPARIADATRVVGAPAMMEDECSALHIMDHQCPIWGNRMISAWVPTPEERAAIANGAPVYLAVVGYSHPVVALFAGDVP